MKTLLITLAYGAILITSWEIQKFDLLLGHTLGVIGVIALTVFLADHLARKVS
jgi:hypothetical protein